MRYGDVPLLAGGTLIPTSTALLFPESDGTHAALTSLYGTPGLREQVRAAVRPLQLPRSLQRSSVHGRRRYRSLHEPVAGRAAGLGTHDSAVGRRRDSSASSKARRPRSRSASSSRPRLASSRMARRSCGTRCCRSSCRRRCRAASALAAKSGSFEGTSLDQSPWIFIPPLDVPAREVQGAWTLNVTVDQYVWMHPNDPTEGHGSLRHVCRVRRRPEHPAHADVRRLRRRGPVRGPQHGFVRRGVLLQRRQQRSRGHVRAVCCPLRNEQGVELYYAGRQSAGAASPVRSRSMVKSSIPFFAAREGDL